MQSSHCPGRCCSVASSQSPHVTELELSLARVGSEAGSTSQATSEAGLMQDGAAGMQTGTGHSLVHCPGQTGPAGELGSAQAIPTPVAAGAMQGWALSSTRPRGCPGVRMDGTKCEGAGAGNWTRERMGNLPRLLASCPPWVPRRSQKAFWTKVHSLITRNKARSGHLFPRLSAFWKGHYKTISTPLQQGQVSQGWCHLQQEAKHTRLG